MNDKAVSRALPTPLASRRAWTVNNFCFKQQVILCLLVVAVRLFSLYVIPDQVGQGVKVTHLELPNKMGKWAGQDIKIDAATFELLRPDFMLQKSFTGPIVMNSRPCEVEVLVVYTRETGGLHRPEICMAAQGWTISRHEQREVKANGQRLLLDVLTGDQHEQHKLIAYTLSDATGAVSGSTATFANMVTSRFRRRNAGALEIQFAYDARVLMPDGDFNPQFKNFMLQIAHATYAQMIAKTAASA